MKPTLAFRSYISTKRHRLRSKFQQYGSALMRLIPAPLLAGFAALLVNIRPLDWYGGWTFGAGHAESSPLTKVRLALWTYFEHHRLYAPFTIRWHDKLKVTIYLGNDLSRCLYVGGTYEPNEFMFLSQVLEPGMTFIDVGANDGLYTLFAARRVGANGKVLAIEPSRREFARLERNVRLNRLMNVQALRVAASDREDWAVLRLAGFGHEGQNTLGGFAYRIEQQGSEEVKLVDCNMNFSSAILVVTALN
jgi:FkbM family methyltransferase